MKFGIVQYLGTKISDPHSFSDRVVEQAMWAERYGWDNVLVGEHHSLNEYLPNPFMAAMYIAGKTNRVNVGSYIGLGPLYNPIRLAEDIAMLDVFSKGRAFVALGIGYQPLDFDVFGIPLKQRVSRFEELGEILIRALNGEKVNYSGRRYKVKDFVLEPKPLQKPRPQVLFAAWSEPGAARAGRIADGLALAPAPKMSSQKGFVKAYSEETRKRGRTPYISVCRDGWISKDKDTAASEAGKYILPTFVYYWSGGGILDLSSEFYKAPGVPDLDKKDKISIDSMADDRWIFGSPDDAIEFIESAQKDYDVKEVQMVLQQTDGNPPQNLVLNQIKLWGEKIIPYFKEQQRK